MFFPFRCHFSLQPPCVIDLLLRINSSLCPLPYKNIVQYSVFARSWENILTVGKSNLFAKGSWEKLPRFKWSIGRTPRDVTVREKVF